MPSVAPPGTRPVTFHGLTVYVPRSWAIDAVKCGAPLTNTIFFGDGAQPACGSTGTSPYSMATFVTWHPGIVDRRLTWRTRKIDGHRATVGTSAGHGAHTTELVVPDIKARLIVGSPSSAIGTRIVRTAQITQHDVNGCPSTMPYVDLTAPPTSGPADVMIAGRPRAEVICSYVQTFLERGIPLSQATANRLNAALNALPSGLSEANPTDYSPELCRGGRLARQGDLSDAEDFSIRLSYAHRPLAIVYARLSLCGALGFSNGSRTGQRIDSITRLFAKLSGTTSWQGGVRPR